MVARASRKEGMEVLSRQWSTGQVSLQAWTLMGKRPLQSGRAEVLVAPEQVVALAAKGRGRAGWAPNLRDWLG